MAVYDNGFAQFHAESDRASGGTNIVNIAGACLSLALMAGVGVWGYQSIMRDVSGIPVVRAMEGQMRVQPDNPGGDVASHLGLSVNEVAAQGAAGATEDLLMLAPEVAALPQEDLRIGTASFDEGLPPVAVEEVAPEVVPAATDALTVAAESVALPDPADQIAALVSQIAAELPEASGVTAGLDGALRPLARPVNRPTEAATRGSETAITTTAFAAGTNLIQLGAFPNPTLAAQEWSRLQRRFGSLLGGYERVIQVSTQSSGTWYRLRAEGFTDRAEARRLCAALQAEGATCIAVVVE